MIKFLINKDSDEKITMTSSTGLPLIHYYKRIVIGGRGPYVETVEKGIKWENFYVPLEEKWRIDSNCCYYNEYRSKDEAYVKLYEQKELVKYADYKIGLFYISPYDLFLNGKCIVEEIKENTLAEFFDIY